jgi:hypothetical protein
MVREHGIGEERDSYHTSLCNRPSSYSFFFSVGAVAVAVAVAVPSTCFASLRIPGSMGEGEGWRDRRKG